MVVWNAAVNPPFGPSQDIPDSAFDKVMACNVRSNHWLCQMTIPGMAERGGGSGILVSSIGGVKGGGTPGADARSETTHMAIAPELPGGWGTPPRRVNCSAPRAVRSPLP